MTREKIIATFETYRNGNISDAKATIKKMTKNEFIDFLEYARSFNIMPYQLRLLV